MIKFVSKPIFESVKITESNGIQLQMSYLLPSIIKNWKFIPQEMQETVHFLSLSALISAANPLQLVKSRIQTMNELMAKGSLKTKYQGIFDCLKTVKTAEGTRALWKGNSIGLLRFFPNEKMNNDVKNYVRGNLPISLWSNIVSGVVGGWVAAGILYPVDTIRIFLATSSQNQKQTLKDLAKKAKVHGTQFLYKGYSSSLLGIAIFRGSYFGVYDSAKAFAKTNEEKLGIAYFSGLSAGILVYPIETIRKKKIIMEEKLSEGSLFKKQQKLKE